MNSTTWHTFINNPDLFITACKMREVTRPGIANATLDPLAETRYYYINALDQVAYGEPPKICEPVRQRAYDTLTTYVEWNWTYDNYGNRDSETDPEGYITEHIYGATANNLFETVTKLPKATRTTPAPDARFRIITTWDTVCGKPISVQDINDQVTGFIYDDLCRETKQTRPGNDFTDTAYENIGNPDIQNILSQRKAPSAAAADKVWSRDYLDGFGRSWKRYAEGNDSTHHVLSETQFNARGEVYRQSAPYFDNGTDTPKWTTYSYDGLDRLTEIANPGGTSSSLAYGNAPDPTHVTRVTVTNEELQAQQYTLDASAKLARRTKLKNGATALDTTYHRDPLGRIDWLTDPVGNKWTYRTTC